MVSSVLGEAQLSAVYPRPSLAIGSAPEVQEKLDHRRPVLEHGEVQRRAVMIEPAHLTGDQRRIGIDETAQQVDPVKCDCSKDGGPGPALHQEFRHVVPYVLKVGRPADGAHLVRVAVVADVGAGIYQPLDRVEVALLGGPVQRGGAIGAVAQVHLEAEPEQQVDALEVPALRCKVQQGSAPLTADDADLGRIFGEQTLQAVRAPVKGGGDDLAVEAHRVDMRLERAPAREPVLPGNVQLGLMQLGAGVAPAQLRQPLLGGLLQPVDIGAGGKCFGHETPSLSAPGVRSSRAERRCGAHRYERWVQPFTRTVGHLVSQASILDRAALKSSTT